MKIRIAAIYFLAFSFMFLCSCSEIIDTPAKELRAYSWEEKSDDDITLSLSFKDDDGVLKIKDKEENKEYEITGTTIVTDKEIKITDINTLTDYSFNYALKGDSVKLAYNGKTLTLEKIEK